MNDTGMKSSLSDSICVCRMALNSPRVLSLFHVIWGVLCNTLKPQSTSFTMKLMVIHILHGWFSSKYLT